MKNEKFLPIGSVVLIKKAQKKLMIIGYCTAPKENDRKFYAMEYTHLRYSENEV